MQLIIFILYWIFLLVSLGIGIYNLLYMRQARKIGIDLQVEMPRGINRLLYVNAFAPFAFALLMLVFIIVQFQNLA